MSDEKPWRNDATRIYAGDGGFDIRNLPNAEDRAALIVRSVNALPSLGKALEAAREFVEMKADDGCKEAIRRLVEIDAALETYRSTRPIERLSDLVKSQGDEIRITREADEAKDAEIDALVKSLEAISNITADCGCDRLMNIRQVADETIAAYRSTRP